MCGYACFQTVDTMDTGAAFGVGSALGVVLGFALALVVTLIRARSWRCHTPCSDCVTRPSTGAAASPGMGDASRFLLDSRTATGPPAPRPLVDHP